MVGRPTRDSGRTPHPLVGPGLRAAVHEEWFDDGPAPTARLRRPALAGMAGGGSATL